MLRADGFPTGNWTHAWNRRPCRVSKGEERLGEGIAGIVFYCLGEHPAPPQHSRDTSETVGLRHRAGVAVGQPGAPASVASTSDPQPPSPMFFGSSLPCGRDVEPERLLAIVAQPLHAVGVREGVRE